jgi:2-polyprenyl-3-methyl-5-hydroxy-6-metoxy-1,4-benzoquinol methylase
MAKYAVRLLFFPWELKWCKILANTHMEGISSIGRVLDVGCGRGYFLATIQRWGFQCFGCEPDPQAAKVAQDAGLEVVCSDLLNAPYSKNQFDVIRFSHVLEHVHFPSAVLQRANELVKPGGLIIVEVPNHVGIVAQSFRQTEDVPRHLYGFTPETLQRYFAQAGLRVTKTVTLTRKPHDIYGQFGRFALEFAKNATEEQKKKIADFWSPTNKRRVKEFEASAKFFDSIGRGSAVAVVGTKD